LVSAGELALLGGCGQLTILVERGPFAKYISVIMFISTVWQCHVMYLSCPSFTDVCAHIIAHCITGVLGELGELPAKTSTSTQADLIAKEIENGEILCLN